MSEQEQDKTYEIRLAIEERMYALNEAGFTIDEVEDFVGGIVDQMREEEEEAGD